MSYDYTSSHSDPVSFYTTAFDLIIGWNALFYAVLRNDHFDIVKLLLDKCKNIEGQDSLGNTALIRACEKEKLPMITYLLNKGAKVNCINHKHHTPLHKATEKGQLEVMERRLHPLLYTLYTLIPYIPYIPYTLYPTLYPTLYVCILPTYTFLTRSSLSSPLIDTPGDEHVDCARGQCACDKSKW